MSATSPKGINAGQELARLIDAVRQGAPAVTQAAARIQQARREQAAAGHQRHALTSDLADDVADDLAGDQARVEAWLADLRRIATLVCDQPDWLSKELGARLEDLRTGLNHRLTAH